MSRNLCSHLIHIPHNNTINQSINQSINEVSALLTQAVLHCAARYCMSNAMHSSIGQIKKSPASPMSSDRWQCPMSDLRPKCEKLQMAITQQRVIRSTLCLVPGWGFWGRRIERRHFRSDQIQDGGRRPFWKTLNGHNSAMHHPIDFVFGFRLGFLASKPTDYIALFNLTAHELHELYYDRPTS